MIWCTYPIVFVLGGILASFSGSAWFGGNGDAEFAKLPKPHLLFSSIGKVVEIPDGSMERFADLLQQNEISVVLFYASWCGQSSAAAREFNRAAKILYKEVSFIAINCWVGTCSKQKTVDQFPKVVAIHSHFDGVEYRGPFKTSKMIAFLQFVLRPFIYIGTDMELNQAKQSNQEVVISYFNQPMRSNKNYTTFFSLALQFKTNDSSPTFAVVTSDKLALKAGVDSVSGVAYHRLNHAVLRYPSSRSFTTRNLTSWIDANRYQLVVQLSLSLDKKRHFVTHLRKGPALILFLPLKLYVSEESQQLLVRYISTASQFFNCSCIRTTEKINTSSQNTQDIDRDNTAVVLKDSNFKEQTLDTLQSILTQGDLMITGKEWHLPMLLVNKRMCQSLQIPEQSNLEKKHNVCDVCYTCQHQHKCHHNMSPGLQSFKTRLSSLRNSCSCFRSGYDLFATTSICCTVQIVEPKNLSSSERQKPSYLESLRQVTRSLDGFLGDVLAAIIPPVSKSALKKGEHEVSSFNVKNAPHKVLSVKDYFDHLPMLSGEETNKNVCTVTDKVVQFSGAGCLSNRSVNFFFMDSTEYWHVAEKLGVRNTPKGKTALVIVDLEADAQFVLDEKLQITNASIVGFVMAYMTGNLSRRFRSNSARPHKCLSSQACVTEVVTSNFHDLVLDETKDVLLLYYASWCAYCQSLGPVLLTVAKFFHNITDVIIARINADENDLPWQLVVPRYPSLIFFPAHRKAFSIRFPDSLERTAANIVQFVLDHGVKASKIFQEFRLPAIVIEKLNKLEMLLCQVEEETGIIEITLRETLVAKERWQSRSDTSSLLKTDVANDETMRMPGKDFNKVLDQQQQRLKEKTLKLVKGSTDVLKQLIASREKLNYNEKLLSQVMSKNRFVFNSEQLYAKFWRTEVALQEQKKVVLELQESLTAVRRRATQLDISNYIHSNKLKNLCVS